MRLCKTCGLEKDLTEFRPVKSNRDGWSLHCRLCVNERQRQRRPKRPYSQRTLDRIVPERKVCRQCGQVKTAEEYTPFQANRDGLFSFCKECMNERGRVRRAENPLTPEGRRRKAESDAADYRKHHAARRFSQIEQRLLSRYGLTAEDFDRILAKQGGRCAICGTDTPGGRGNRFHVDHSHETGEVRGLLCWRCNIRLGVVENHEWMGNAHAYLHRRKQ